MRVYRFYFAQVDTIRNKVKHIPNSSIIAQKYILVQPEYLIWIFATTIKAIVPRKQFDIGYLLNMLQNTKCNKYAAKIVLASLCVVKTPH